MGEYLLLNASYGNNLTYDSSLGYRELGAKSL